MLRPPTSPVAHPTLQPGPGVLGGTSERLRWPPPPVPPRRAEPEVLHRAGRPAWAWGLGRRQPGCQATAVTRWRLGSWGPGARGSNTHTLPLAKALSVDGAGDGVLRCGWQGPRSRRCASRAPRCALRHGLMKPHDDRAPGAGPSPAPGQVNQIAQPRSLGTLRAAGFSSTFCGPPSSPGLPPIRCSL